MVSFHHNTAAALPSVPMAPLPMPPHYAPTIHPHHPPASTTLSKLPDAHAAGSTAYGTPGNSCKICITLLK